MEAKPKVIVITGGGRGIGRSLAESCAKEGYTVVVTARTETELKETTDAITREGKGVCHALRCDVAKPPEVTRLFEICEKEFGPIFGLICAAGVYGPIGPFSESPLEEWEKAVEINLFGTARCVHAVLPAMKGRKEGRIILFSGGGQAAMPNFSAYVTGKGGIWRFTETLGQELHPYGIFVNAVAPGAINTRLLDDLLAAGPEKVGEEAYQKSLAQKQKGGASLAKAQSLVSYLLSEKSKGLAGKVMSALWDPFGEITDPQRITQTDLYTMRRVTNPDGGTRA